MSEDILEEPTDYRSRNNFRRTISIEERSVKNGLTQLSFQVPIKLLKYIDALCEQGNYLNRSEFFREALRDKIEQKLKLQSKKADLCEYYDSKLKKE